MKSLYKILLLVTVFTFLTTYSPKKDNLEESTKKFFLNIKKIEVTNHNKIKESEIIEKLNHIIGKNIIFIKSTEIEEPLVSIDFLKKIEVKKKYPDTIIIKVFETEPLAILFKNKNKYIIDDLSNLMPLNEDVSYKNFPSVFGKDAEKDFVNFFNQLQRNKFPNENIGKYYFFQINRWDVQLLNKQIIKFPNQKREIAIKRSIELLNRNDFKNYKVIDLRIHGKIVVE
tara:strand:- start:266 stop:949 length:684 start_codon:yes stop_codon:yes gene_type:complete